MRTDVEQSLATRIKYKAKDNLTAGEHSAPKALMARVIKPADKESGVVVLGMADYLQEAERQLQNGSPTAFLMSIPWMKLSVLSQQRFMICITERSSTSTHIGSSCPESPDWQGIICCLRFISLELWEGELCHQATRRRETSRNTLCQSFSLATGSTAAGNPSRQDRLSESTENPLNVERRLAFRHSGCFIPVHVYQHSPQGGHRDLAAAHVLNQRSVCDSPTEDLCSLIEVILKNNIN